MVWQKLTAALGGLPGVSFPLFVGSSSEGFRIAEAVRVVLDPACEVELWDQGIFGLTQGTLESLVLAVSRFDFALVVLTADDMTVSRRSDALDEPGHVRSPLL